MTDTLVRHVRGWGIVAALVGLAPGLAVWPLLHHEYLGYVLDGKMLDVDQRVQMVAYMLSSLLAVAALYLAAYLLLRRRVPRLSLYEAFRRLNRYTFVIATMPFLSALMHRGIETEHQFMTLLFIAVCTTGLGVFIYRLYEARPERPAATERVGWRWGPPLAVMCLFLFYAVYVSWLALSDHYALGTHVFDLGIYDNIFWHNANGNFMGCSYCKTGKHMSSHFDPILWVLSPVYRLNPRAETLLVLQSVWLATGVFPLYFVGKRRLENPWLGVLLGCIYVCYPHLHGANMFDFHSLTLVVPTLMWSIYCVDAGRLKTYWFVLAVMLITREDISLLSCFIGVYAIMKGRPKTGLVTIVVALTYLTLVKAYVMNDPGLIMQKSAESTSFHYFYEEMIPHEGEGMKGLVITMATNPVYSLKVFFKEDKVFFFILLFLPLLFLPLAAAPKRVMFLYGLVFIGTATRKYVYSPYFQYSSIIFPLLMTALPDGVDRVARSRLAQVYGLTHRRLVWTLMWTSLVATLLCNHKYGVFWANDAFRAGWNTLARGRSEERTKRYKFVRRLIDEYIPDDAAVCASSSLGSQLSNREKIDKWPKYTDADFLLLSESRFKSKSMRRLERLLRRGTYRLVEEEFGIGLYEKVPEEEQAEERRKFREQEAKNNPPSTKSSSVRTNGGKQPRPDADRPKPIGTEDERAGPDEARGQASDKEAPDDDLDDDLDDAPEGGDRVEGSDDDEEGGRPG